MAITFMDEDMVYLDKEQDTQLPSIRQAIDALKVKADTAFCRKCGHMMQYFTVGMQSFSSVFSAEIELQR